MIQTQIWSNQVNFTGTTISPTIEQPYHNYRTIVCIQKMTIYIPLKEIDSGIQNSPDPHPLMDWSVFFALSDDLYRMVSGYYDLYYKLLVTYMFHSLRDII